MTNDSRLKDKNIINNRYRQEESQFYDCTRGGKKEKHAKTWFEKDTIDAWRHKRMYRLLDPLLIAYPKAIWLTVGDGRYGKDAHYIRDKGLKVLASDISDVLLKEGKEIGYIDDYSKQNAEDLTFSDEEFDFVFCKESYHHFPRPMIALYEMLRVVKKGVILIEPVDQYILSTFIEALYRNTIGLLKILLGKKYVSNHYEEVGNYIYTISKREIEKVALGMNLRAIAFKGINDYYLEGVEYQKALPDNKLFKLVKRRIFLRNLLTVTGLRPWYYSSFIIFKENSTLESISNLKECGYKIVTLLKNPYL